MEQKTNHELMVIEQPLSTPSNTSTSTPKGTSFIEANTISISLQEIKEKHIIPVFVKDNETVISHTDFVQAVQSVVEDYFQNEIIKDPVIRVSHPIKGRVPDAKFKAANELAEYEKTIYYERMAFMIEVPSITDVVDGNELTLTIGGVKSYAEDNLYSRSICDQHFKLFIGFKNTVCTNLCVWSDGYVEDLKVRHLNQLGGHIKSLIERYNQGFHLYNLKQLCKHSITEQQFAQIVGRCRMYNHLPHHLKVDIQPILFGDQQLSSVVKDFYKDESFCRDDNGNINLWKLYNLFTGANKSSYIDSLLDRSVNAFNLVEQIRYGLENKNTCWYLQ